MVVDGVTGLKPKLQILQFFQLSNKKVQATMSDGGRCSERFELVPEYFIAFGAKISVNRLLEVFDYDITPGNVV